MFLYFYNAKIQLIFDMTKQKRKNISPPSARDAREFNVNEINCLDGQDALG